MRPGTGHLVGSRVHRSGRCARCARHRHRIVRSLTRPAAFAGRLLYHLSVFGVATAGWTVLVPRDVPLTGYLQVLQRLIQWTQRTHERAGTEAQERTSDQSVRGSKPSGRALAWSELAPWTADVGEGENVPSVVPPMPQYVTASGGRVLNITSPGPACLPPFHKQEVLGSYPSVGSTFPFLRGQGGCPERPGRTPPTGHLNRDRRRPA